MDGYAERFPQAAAEFRAAADRKAVNALHRKYVKLYDEDATDVCIGAIEFFYQEAKERTEVCVERSAAEARADRILSITDSSGRKTSRRNR